MNQYISDSKLTSHFFRVLLCPLLLIAGSATHAQELDVPYVETPEEIVSLMMDISGAGKDDYVIDLGTGDGRLVLEAVKRGAMGQGIDIDPERVREAQANARQAGLTGKVIFLEQDLFESDISHASLVTMFLNYEVNLELRPRLLAELAPGTRIVSHNFDLGDWAPDKHEQVLRNVNNNFYIHDVYFWVVPADIAGDWRWTTLDKSFRLSIEQTFQHIKPLFYIDEKQLTIEEADFEGDRISLVAKDPSSNTYYSLNGNTDGSEISGVIQIQGRGYRGVHNWQVSRDL